MLKSTMLRAATPLIAWIVLFSAAVGISAQARVLGVGPGQEFASLNQAAIQSHPGDVIRLSTGVHADCVTLGLPDVTLEGSGRPEETTLEGVACAGKAAVVALAPRITLRNLTLAHVHVPDFNGAGIRAEGGDLLVDHVRFVGNENGILAANDPQAQLIIRDSEFLGNGSCAHACAHGVYANHIGLLRIERSRFEATRAGHHIKSRALRTEIIGCDIADGPDGTASYSIEAPNGGALLVRDVRIEKGPQTGNHRAAIIIGAEGGNQPTPSLRIEASRFRRDGGYPSAFVVNLSTTPAQLVGNQMSGSDNPAALVMLLGPGSVE